MAKLKKLLNANYLHHEVPTLLAVNENNRVYIDRFVSDHYKSLSRRFAAIGSNINSSGFGALDKLNETLCSLYTNPDLSFKSWEEAKAFLQNKFTEKEMRVPLKRKNLEGEGQDEESTNEGSINIEMT